MSKTAKTKRKVVSTDAIARAAHPEKDDSRRLTNRGRMMPAIRWVNGDFSSKVLAEPSSATTHRLN